MAVSAPKLPLSTLRSDWLNPTGASEKLSVRKAVSPTPRLALLEVIVSPGGVVSPKLTPVLVTGSPEAAYE
ncbi:hypothetical protein OCOJLMKI_5192 [Methylobacterium iners]|uniref:Uncharacterized protein n=1 Tax=Methylobacterium iners TaxID=418707 RepID=A0ABQ4S826_9HYPH|nr:hypothetical protein OCOJLMKI_5192 [Methylobacterium iners]